MVTFAYERQLFMRGSNYSDLAREILVFWKSGSLREGVAKGGSTVFFCSAVKSFPEMFL